MSTANVLKLALKAAADVQVNGTVSQVEVDSNKASVNVSKNATVFAVKMNAAGEVSVSGEVLNIVVADTAEGAKVDLAEGSKVKDIVVGANGTEIKVAESANVESVKVSETVTGATIPDTVTTETVSKDQLDEYSKHTHLYKFKQKIAQTCTSDGKEVYECEEDGEVYEKILKALGHDYKYETVEAPTLLDSGKGKYTCTRCGDSYNVDLKPEGATVVTISGIDEVLRQVFGEGLQVNLGDMTYVRKKVKTYKDDSLKDPEYTYHVNYMKQCDLRLDFSDEEKVTGSFNLMVYALETDDISNVNLSALSAVEFDEEIVIHAYLDGEKVYVYYNNYWGYEYEDEYYVLANLYELLEYSANEGYNVVRVLANVLKTFIDLDGKEVDTTAAVMILGAVKDALTSFNSADGMNALVKFSLDKFFTKTVGENGLTTYDFDFEKVKDALEYYGDMTLANFVDEVFGKNASKNLFDALRLVPDLTVNDAVTYLKKQLANYSIDLEKAYPYVESFIYENLGVAVSVEELLETFGESNVAAFIALIRDIDLDEADKIVTNVIEGVIGYMNSTTVDDALTYLYNYFKGIIGDITPDEDYPSYPDEDEYYAEDGESEEDTSAEDLTVVKYLCSLIDYVKDYVGLQYVTGENFDKVYVDVAGYNFTLEIDENNGFTLGTAFAFAEEVMAEISLKLNENKFALSADVLNYSVEASADKENGTFTVSVYETAQSEDEEATLADKEEIASLTFACVDNMLTLRLSIFGDDYVDFTADSNEGNFNLLIPIDVDEHLLVNLIWTTENNVTTVYLSYEETVLRFVLDLSDKASLAISLGEFNEEEFVATYENIFTADVSLSTDEEGTLIGMTVEYTIDARNVDLLVDSWFDTWNGEIIAEYSTFFYLLKDKVEISFNQKITVDETNKDVAKGDIEKFKKLEFEYVDVPYWIAGYCLYYVEEEVDGEVDNYYLLNVTELYGVSYIYVYEMIIDCDENGCPVIPMLRYENYCADWCYLDLQFGGETTVTQYKGCSIEETSIVDKYVDFREFSVDFYYNVKTGETADDIDHTWTVTDVKYRSDSHKCEDGLSV